MLHNRAMVRFLFILAAAASFFIFATEAAAQTLGASPVQYTVTPEAPSPGATVNIDIAGVGTFIGDSNITWQQDGKTVESGVGKHSYTFVAGPLGSQTTVVATINSSSQGVISKSFTFRPSLVDMLWEAQTSVPPWYAGKSLYTAGSTITVTAIPQIVSNGKTLSANSLSFQWSRNGTPMPQASGGGQSSITFAGNQLYSQEDVSVDVLLGGAAVAHGEIIIPASKPQVVLYVQDPLRGTLYDSALSDSLSLSQTEITVQAVPYFFANSSINNGSVPFAWTLNGSDASGPQTAQGVLTLRQSGSGAGQASLAVSMQNNDSDKYVQSAQTALTILFGGASASAFNSFFGL